MAAFTQKDLTKSMTTAMETIAKARVDSKDATLVIEAEVIEIIDEGVGIYRVKYLGNTFNATVTNTEIIYEVGDLVYVVVPNGDFNKNKIILSPVNTNKVIYADTVGDISYISLGDNLFQSVSDISLCTYKPHDSQIVKTDTTGFASLIQASLLDSRVFNFTCKIRTAIEESRRNTGNYGIILDIPVLQTVNGVQEYAYYSVTLDVYNITGEPYNLTMPALQNVYFTLPDDMVYNEDDTPRVRTFVKDFLGEDPTKPDDIFITEIQLLPILELTAETMKGYYAHISATDGYSFLGTRTGDVKTLSASVYFNGRITKLNKFDCYWFRENVTITNTSERYLAIGGRGWELLNPVSTKNIGEDGKVNYQYVTNNYTQIVKQSELHCDTRYKCVLVQGGTVVSSIVTIKNLATRAKIELISLDGTNIYPTGIGNVNLQLSYYEKDITDIETPDFTIGYAWQRLDKNGNFLDDNFYITDIFNERIENIYTDETGVVKREKTYYTKIHYPVSKINDSNIIGCTVYIETPIRVPKAREDGTQYFEIKGVNRQIIGTKWINISTGDFIGGRIILDNADKLYKYDADGDSPMVADYDGPLTSAIKTINPIIAKLFKEDGTEFTADEYAVSTLNWLVPINSMYTLTKDQKTDTTTNPGYYTISGKYEQLASFQYGISATYNKNKVDNTIIVRATAPKAVLPQTISASTSIRFLKDGESGTNGSRYSAIVTYNGHGYGEKDDKGNICKLQLVYAAAGNKGWYLYNPSSPNVYDSFDYAQLDVNLYADGEKVIERSGTVTWAIFDNDYGYNEDNIVIPLKILNGLLTIKDGLHQEWTDPSKNYCAIIEAKVPAKKKEDGILSVTNSEEYVYAYYPIEFTYITHSDFLKSCIPTVCGGFSRVLYASDGTNPQYDNSEPFYIVDPAHEKIEDYYTFYWTTSHNMKIIGNKDRAVCKVTPTAKYDNGIAKNFVRIVMGQNAETKARLQAEQKECEAQLSQYRSERAYYRMLQSNLDIFGNFKYNNYVAQLGSTLNVYDNKVKTHIIIKQQLMPQNQSIIDLCGMYINVNGSRDSAVDAVLEAANAIDSKLKELDNLVSQIGIYENMIIEIKDTMQPVMLINSASIKYGEGSLPQRNCYLSINDAITAYNSTVNLIYRNAYNNLTAEKTIDTEPLAKDIVDNLKVFVNNVKLLALTKPHFGVDLESYRYKGLVSTLQAIVDSIIDDYSYNDMVQKVLIPMNTALTWYIEFAGIVVVDGQGRVTKGYKNTISSLSDKIDEFTKKLQEYNDMLLPGLDTSIVHIKPIFMVYNRYEMSHINGWDGNKLKISEDNGYILAPQVGAGKKEPNNTFTGIVMGVKQVQENTSQQAAQKVGLFAFKGRENPEDPSQTFFLNAEDGSAIFGMSGSSQIVIDPTATKDGKHIGMLYSANFWDSKNYKIDGKPSSYEFNKNTLNYQGMLIDLSTPEIRWGNGNFLVNKEGHITAVGGGSIAGWEIGEYTWNKERPAEEQFDTCVIRSIAQEQDGRMIIDSGASKTRNEKGDIVYTAKHPGRIFTGLHDHIGAFSDGFYLSKDGISIKHSWEETDEITGEKETVYSSLVFDLSKSNDGPEIYSNGHNKIDSTRTGFYLGQNGLSMKNTWTEKENGEDKKYSASLVVNLTETSPEIYSNGHKELDSLRDGWYIGEKGMSFRHSWEADEVDSNNNPIKVSRWNTFKVNLDSPVGTELNSNGCDLTNSRKGFYLSNQGFRIKSDAGQITMDLRDSSADHNPVLYSNNHAKLETATTGFYLGNDGLSIGTQAKFTSTGMLRIGQGALTADPEANCWTISAGTQTYVIPATSTQPEQKITTDDASFVAYRCVDFASDFEHRIIGGRPREVYLGTNGLRLGNKFIADNNGNIICQNIVANKSGEIAGWKIEGTKLTSNISEEKIDGDEKNKKITVLEIDSAGELNCHILDNTNQRRWYVKKNGKAYFKNLEVAGDLTVNGTFTGNANGKFALDGWEFTPGHIAGIGIDIQQAKEGEKNGYIQCGNVYIGGEVGNGVGGVGTSRTNCIIFDSVGKKIELSAIAGAAKADTYDVTKKEDGKEVVIGHVTIPSILS